MSPVPPVTRALADDLTGRTLESLSTTAESVLVSFSGALHICFLATLELQLPPGASVPPSQSDLAKATQRRSIAAQSHNGYLPAEILKHYAKQPMPPEIALALRKVTAANPHADPNQPGVAIELDGKYLLDISPLGFNWYRVEATERVM